MNQNDRIIEGRFDYGRISQSAAIPLICIYENPDDYPGFFVARVWDADQPTHLIAKADTLDGIRETIPPNMHRLHRRPDDDPVIVEVWI